MKRTEILCPDCMKGKLLTSNEINAHCDRCGENFIITGKNSVRYKKDSDLSEEQRTNPNKDLACIASNGARVNAEDFTYRKRIPMTEEIKKTPSVDYKSISDIDDGSKYEWVQVGEDKYGRSMYCIKTGIRRSQTMGEFYGGGSVD
jgi:hypothetical protein